MGAAKKKFYVVTTEHRGVFGGYLVGTETEAKVVTLTEAQMCVYWSVDVRGVLGLAASGPSKSCKVTPAVPKIVLQGVTAVIECSAEAEAAWKARPWQ